MMIKMIAKTHNINYLSENTSYSKTNSYSSLSEVALRHSAVRPSGLLGSLRN